MRKKKSKKHLKRTRNDSKVPFSSYFSKPFVLSISIVFSLIIIIYATYAWNTAADEKTNKFSGTRLSAEIVETFVPNLQWNPGTQTEKVIQVANTGEAAAFVRVSLHEYLTTFKVDVEDRTGNGNLEKTSESGEELSFDNFDKWKMLVENHDHVTYPVNDEKKDEFYIAYQAYENPYVQYNEVREERKDPFQYLKIDYTDRVKDTVSEAIESKNQWFYEDGYFYFTSVLYPGEMTTPLTHSVTLSKRLPNAYKGSLYVLDVKMDAVDIIEGSLEDWKIDTNSNVYKVLEKHVVSY